MDIRKEFVWYVAYLYQGLGHADRHAGLSAYCIGSMLPLPHKSAEPMATCVGPLQHK
ncbi:MAG: hypothetical protein H7293_15040 [Candidatus Saccharibacteria bacterium]|nr:hypothetical protein [Rhodoferax sp.]